MRARSKQVSSMGGSLSSFPALLRRAAFSGFLAGAALTAFLVSPMQGLIAEAERYEFAAHAHEHNEHAHEHDNAPDNGSALVRNLLLTLSACLLVGLGFALLLEAFVSVLGIKFGFWYHGAVIGAGGFLVFLVLPGIGIGFSLPGDGVPDTLLVGRQTWWLTSVLASLCGLSMLCLARTFWLRLAGCVLIALPFIALALLPSLDAPENPALPSGLRAQFYAAILVSGAGFWLVLGMATGWLHRREQNS